MKQGCAEMIQLHGYNFLCRTNMNVMRYFVVSIVLAALCACGPDQEPAKSPGNNEVTHQSKAESTSPATTAASPVETVDKPEPAPESKADAADKAVKLDLDLDLKPVPKLETEFEPEIETEPEVEQPVKQVLTAKPVVKVPEVKIDLSLPQELARQLNEADTNEYSSATVLPPMFTDKETQPKPFELTGKLLTDDSNGKDSLDAIDGAQLQFKFKQ